ncbi:MAG: type II toxin-antitoxin system RelE/ParE family toxin [Ignavibacteriales bacterium]|nr:type II toxin-antitoxin system RelE/ParE family toxin [Ignavibacteriales bacterium]
MKYSISFKPSASNDIESLPVGISQRILTDIEKLKYNPRPVGCRKIIGSKNDWRIRIGDYRVLYEVDDTDHGIRIFRIKHRKEAYR